MNAPGQEFPPTSALSPSFTASLYLTLLPAIYLPRGQSCACSKSSDRHTKARKMTDQIFIAEDETAVVNDLATRLMHSKNVGVDDVVGSEVVAGSRRVLVHHYPLSKAGVHEAVETIIGEFETVEKARSIASAILRTTHLPMTKRTMYVVINPASGTGKSLLIWENYVRPMLVEHAGINFPPENVIVTTRPNEALERTKGFDLSSCDGIIAIGGDGTMYEVVQGLLGRDDWREAIKVPLSLIPGGSGNGLPCSILYQAGMSVKYSAFFQAALNISFLIARGSTKKCDISVVENAQGKMFSFLSVSWGFGSEVDIGSEVCRCCGSIRFTLYALQLIWCSCQTYNAVLHLLPPSASPRRAPSVGHGKDEEDDGPTVVSLENNLLPPLSTPIGQAHWDQGWKTIDLSKNQFFMATQVPYVEPEMKFNPESKLDDGLMSIQLVDGANPCQFTGLLLSLETGDHLNIEKVNAYNAIAFRLEPLDGLVVVDGELVETSPVQAQCHQGVLTMYG